MKQSNMNILVTGGAGFIGSHLVDALVDKHKVVVLDSLTTGKESNVNPKAEFYRCDVRDIQDVRKIFKYEKVDAIYHLAAEARIPKCTENPRETEEINVGGTLNMLEVAREFKVKKFIFASSSSVYGRVSYPISEDESMDPISIYALQKMAAEKYVKMYSEYFKVPTLVFRYFNVYGTYRQAGSGYTNVFGSFYRDMKKLNKIFIYGDGEQKRDFIHVYDLVKAHLRVLKWPKSEFDGSVYNLGTGVSTSINEVAEYFSVKRIYKQARKEDVKLSQAHMKSIFLEDFNIPIDEGVKIFMQSFKKK